jgi:hypothetical protein
MGDAIDVNVAIGLLGGAHQIAYKGFMGYRDLDRDDLRNLLEHCEDALRQLGLDPAKEQERRTCTGRSNWCSSSWRHSGRTTGGQASSPTTPPDG